MRSDQDIAAQLRSMELSLLTPVARQASVLAELLADDFVEFGSSGRTFDKGQVIESLKHESPIEISATEMEISQLGDGVFLLRYRACRSGEPAVHSLRSSIWRLRGGRWQMVFHQGTVTDIPGVGQ